MIIDDIETIAINHTRLFAVPVESPQPDYDQGFAGFEMTDAEVRDMLAAFRSDQM
jgi:hypothetical protein